MTTTGVIVKRTRAGVERKAGCVFCIAYATALANEDDKKEETDRKKGSR